MEQVKKRKTRRPSPPPPFIRQSPCLEFKIVQLKPVKLGTIGIPGWLRYVYNLINGGVSDQNTSLFKEMRLIKTVAFDKYEIDRWRKLRGNIPQAIGR